MAEHYREHEEHERRRRGGEAREHGEHEKKEHERRAEGGRTMHTEMDEDRPDDKKGGHVRRPRRARGGKSEAVHVYNAVGSPEQKEAEDESETFKHGGRRHRRHGGHAGGENAEHRADKMPRGRRAHGGAAKHVIEHHGAEHVEHHHHRHGGAEHHRRAAGGSVWSTGSKIALKEGSEASRGKEGGQGGMEEPKPG